jgi:putative transcriptional regulator
MVAMSMVSLRGRLLVATPSLGDLNFDRTVVLLLEHGAEGAVGVVLNRPSDIDVRDPLPGWAGLVDPPAKVYFGGPVAQGSVLGLADTDGADERAGWSPLIGSLGTLDLSLAPDQLEVTVRRLRIFTGYSGWSDGQLENEISGGSWFVADRADDDPFVPEPASLWADVMKRQGSTDDLLAGAPRHPWLN